jgi:hypothetical protein
MTSKIPAPPAEATKAIRRNRNDRSVRTKLPVERIPLLEMGPMIRLVIAILVIANDWTIAQGHPSISTFLQFPSLPENPCELLTIQQISFATGLEVIEMRRVPDIAEIVRAQEEGRNPGPGNICSYRTISEFGEINIDIPPQAERNVGHYWKTRDSYFRTFPGSADPISGLGKDAWIGGGTSLHVLVRDDVHLGISTQFYQRRSREVVVDVARYVLRQF